MKRTLLILLLLALSFKGYAATVFGSSITYKHVSGNTYLVILKTIRDCRDISVYERGITISCDSGSKSVLLLTKSIRNVTFNHKTACNPANQTNSNPGTEEHTFEYLLDLDTIAKGKFRNCCKIWISHTYCCRSNGINLTSGNSYYECMLDRCLAAGNSGPVFFNTNAFQMRYNQPNYYNLMALDTTDNDLLTYEQAVPRNDISNFSIYKSGYSEKYPLTPLCSQAGQKNCQPSPTALPPRGIYADSFNGNLIFTPTKTGEVTVICFKVSEYRMINGIKTLIGYYITDNQHTVWNSQVNEPTLTKSTMKLEHHFVIGKSQTINFATEQNDTNRKDSVRIFITNPIKNSSVSINAKWRSDGSFTWTPTCKDIRNEPYFFIVHFYNESQYTYEFQSIAMNIYVHPDLELGNDTVICKNGTLQLKSNITGSYRWNGKNSDSLQTFVANKPGKYWVDVTRNGCTVSDTILLSEISSLPVIDLGRDTVICDQPVNSTITLQTAYQANVRYAWNIQPTNPLSFLYFKDTGLVILKGENVCGTKTDTIRVRRMNRPAIQLPADTLLCSPFMHRINPSGDKSGQWLWSDQSKDSFLDVNTGGLYWAKSTNLCGTDADSIFIKTMVVPRVSLGKDTFVCNANYPRMNAAFPGATYLWSNGDTTAFLQCLDSGLFSVRLDNYCGSAKDSIMVKSQFTPVVDLGPDMTACIPIDKTLNAGFPYCKYLWSSSSTSSSMRVTSGGTYWVKLSNLCGTDADTIRIFEKTKPTVNLGKDSSLKKPFTLLLHAGAGANSYLWNTSASDTFPSLTVNDFGTYSIRVGNTCGYAFDTITISAKTGIDEYLSSLFRVYPNPSKDGIFSVENDNVGILQVQVFGMDGKILKELTLSGNILDLHELPAGIYYLSIQTNMQRHGTWLIRH